MALTILLTIGLLLPLVPRLPGQAPSPLKGVDLVLEAVADSGDYFVYSYSAATLGDSRGGAAVVLVDVSAPAGTGFPVLQATGRFYHGAGFPGVKLATFKQHVPIGPISPPHWEAFLTKPGTLDWYGGRGGASGEYDSIAPGEALRGFGLRSSYLPGVRAFWAQPTFSACCGTARRPSPTNEAEYGDPSKFRVPGWTVGPTVRPTDMSLPLLRSDFDQACGRLHWISDGPTCGALHSTLGAGTPDALQAFIAELESDHSPGKAVNDNAYWLLKVNAEYLLAHT